MTPVYDFVLRFKNIPPGAESDFPAAFRGADVLVVAESHQRDAAVYCPAGWGVVQFGANRGARGTHGRIAIYYRKQRFQLEFKENPLLNEANGLTFPGAKRFAARVILRDMVTGWRYDIEGDHFVPHADDPRHPGAIITTPRGRRAVIPAIQSVVRRTLASRVGQKIRVGDYNIDLDADLRHHSANDMLERVNAAGLYSDVQLLGAVPDTHGHNEYDWVLVSFKGPRRLWTRRQARVWLVDHGTGPKRKSDHRDRWIRVRATVKRGWKVPPGFAR